MPKKAQYRNIWASPCGDERDATRFIDQNAMDGLRIKDSAAGQQSKVFEAEYFDYKACSSQQIFVCQSKRCHWDTTGGMLEKC